MDQDKSQTYAEALATLVGQSDPNHVRLERIFARVSDVVAKTVHVDQASIWKFHPVGLEVRCLAVNGYPESQAPAHQVDLTPYMAYRTALQSEQVLVCGDLSTDPAVAKLPQEYWLIAGIKACLHIPIRAFNEVMGILRLDVRQQRDWDREDMTFCQRVADLLSQILLAHELRLRTQRNETFKKFTTDITRHFSLQPLLNDLVRRCVEALGSSFGVLFLTDIERREIVTTASYNPPKEYISPVFRYGEDVAVKVVETGRDLMIGDYRTWPGRSGATEKDEPLAAILSVPLQSHESVLGVLQVVRRNGEHPFTDDDRECLLHFAGLASLAIEQNQIIETNDRLSQFQTTLNQIIETTTFASSVVDFLETTADYVTHALATPLAAVRVDEIYAVRGFPPEMDERIDGVLKKRGRRFKLATVVRDVEVSHAGNPDLAEVMKHFHIRAYVLAPVLTNQDRIGYLCIASKFPRNWTSEESTMVEITAHQIGLAVEGIRFYQETQAQVGMTRHLTHITSSLNRLVALDEMIPVIGQGAAALLHANFLVLVLRMDEQVRTAWMIGMPKLDVSPVVNENGDALLNLFSADPEPMLVTNIERSSLPHPLKKYLAAEGMKSVKMIPIFHSGNVIGLVAAFYDTLVEWPARDRELVKTFANTAALALQNVWMYAQLEKGYMDLALALADAMDARDSQTRTLSLRVADWAQRTAQLLGLSESDQEALRWAAMLHDIGKVDVPDGVLQKPGPLSREELKILQRCPVKSESLIRPLARYREVGTIVRSLRERFDGRGYPDKRKGNDIPLPARILAVADAYGSMIDNRPYRQARSPEDAVQEIMKNSGTQFDPAVVNAFLQVVPPRPSMKPVP